MTGVLWKLYVPWSKKVGVIAESGQVEYELELPKDCLANCTLRFKSSVFLPTLGKTGTFLFVSISGICRLIAVGISNRMNYFWFNLVDIHS